MKKSVEEIKQEYFHHAHRMQTGVAYKMNFDKGETTPKHLRVGINSALSDSAALAALLIKKGIINEEEYCEAVRDQMKLEADAYEKEIQENLGGQVTLGSLY